LKIEPENGKFRCTRHIDLVDDLMVHRAAEPDADAARYRSGHSSAGPDDSALDAPGGAGEDISGMSS
jgi:hypothetical protein